MKKLYLFVGLLLSAGIASAQTSPIGATVKSKVVVPQSMRTAPYNVDRYAMIPENFTLSVYARVGNARFMAITPSGDLLVSQPNAGTVEIVRPNPGGDPTISDFVGGLNSPHDIVFHTIGDSTFVYISERNQVNRYKYVSGDLKAHDREIVVSGLPDRTYPGINGSYAHELKNIALDSNHKLYVSIGSTCNACATDTVGSPIRGAIYQFDADGKNMKLFARGIRNAEGLAFVPGTNDLWVVINNRDNIIYPYQDNTNQYGKLVTSFVDNNPPEEFTRIVDGGNYGWPFCNPDPQQGYNNMPFDLDYEYNKNGAVDCSKMNRISKGINAHSAPLGLLFTQGTNMSAPYNNGAVVALHGSWNRTKATGYKVVYFPWNSDTQTPGDQISLVDGFLQPDSVPSDNFARPVDIAIDKDGNLFISDDDKGTIFKLSANTVTASDNPDNGAYLIVHPRVVDGKVNTFIETKYGGMAKIGVFNVQGVEVYETTRALEGGLNNVSLNPSLTSGIYFIKVSLGNQEVSTKIPVFQ